MYIVSACLVGVDCKYNGGNNKNDKVIDLVKQGRAVLVCPEQLGGLPTPRLPSEIQDKECQRLVVSTSGEDVTEQFLKGAKETLNIANMMNIKKAILKSRSPSCGYGKIYDGSFTKTLKDGNGFTAELLISNGIEIFNEESLELEEL